MFAHGLPFVHGLIVGVVVFRVGIQLELQDFELHIACEIALP